MILSLLLVALFGMVVNGYRYGYSDQSLYIPMIDRTINPTLFPNDYLFDEPSGEYNFWVPTVALLARFFTLEWIFFIGYLLTRFGLVWAVYHVSLNLFGRRGAAVLAVLLLIIPKSVGGTATGTQDIFFTLRSTVMPLAIAFLIPYFRGNSFLAALMCGIAFLIHPITAVPLVCLLGLRLIIDSVRLDWRVSVKACGVFLICTLPLLIRVFLIHRANPSDLSLFSRSDEQWLEIIRRRDSYIFLSVWNRDAFASIATYLVILLAILVFRRWKLDQQNRETDFWAYGLIGVCIGLFIVGGVFVEWYPLPLVVQLQVLRSLYLLINVSMIYLAWTLWYGVDVLANWRRWIGAKRLIANGAVIVAVFVQIALGKSETIAEVLTDGQLFEQVHLPGKLPMNGWIDVGRWCRDHTPTDATFFVPVRIQGFRTYSKRSIVGDWKDGAPCVFSERYAKAWWGRMEDLDNYDAFDEAQFNRLKGKYGATFAVTRISHQLNFPIAYQNDEFIVYSLREP